MEEGKKNMRVDLGKGSYMIEIPNLEQCVAIMERVLKQAVSSGQRVALAPQDGAIGQNQALQQLEVVVSDAVADVDGSP